MLKILITNKFVYSINIAGTPDLMNKSLDFIIQDPQSFTNTISSRYRPSGPQYYMLFEETDLFKTL